MKLTEKLRTRSPVVVAGSLIVLGGALLPWGRSGRTDRSSFELVRLARRLDVLDGALAAAANVWLLAPAAVAGVVVAAGFERRRTALVLGTALAVVGVALGIAVHRSPLIVRSGVCVTMTGAAVLGVGGAREAVDLLRERRPRPTASRSERPR